MELTISGRIITIDEQDKELVMSHNWSWIDSGSVKEKLYLVTGINKKTHYLHRMILSAKKGQIADHKDGNTLNFTRNNLRIVTASQNRFNASVCIKKEIRSKGVYRKPNRSAFYSMIQITGKKTVYKGGFETEVEAAKWYKDKCIELCLV